MLDKFKKMIFVSVNPVLGLGIFDELIKKFLDRMLLKSPKCFIVNN